MAITFNKSFFGKGIHLVTLRPSSTPEQFLKALSFENTTVDELDLDQTTPPLPEMDGLDCVSFVLPNEIRGKQPPRLSFEFKSYVLESLSVPVFIFSDNAGFWVRRLIEDACIYLTFDATTMSGRIVKNQVGAIANYEIPNGATNADQ